MKTQMNLKKSFFASLRFLSRQAQNCSGQADLTCPVAPCYGTGINSVCLSLVLSQYAQQTVVLMNISRGFWTVSERALVIYWYYIYYVHNY